jgi:hypothetical protein
VLVPVSRKVQDFLFTLVYHLTESCHDFKHAVLTDLNSVEKLILISNSTGDVVLIVLGYLLLNFDSSFNFGLFLSFHISHDSLFNCLLVLQLNYIHKLF